MLRKIFLVLVKVIPVIQMAGILFNNMLYYFEVNNAISYTIDFMIGNSIITTILLYICSYTFKFCIWHRLIITANFINLCIANYDAIIGIPITDIQLLIIYHIVACIFIIAATVIHIKQNYEHKAESTKKIT